MALSSAGQLGPVLLIDAMSLTYRAFFALPPMGTVRGTPTSALYGFAALVLKLLREERPCGAAIALDAPGATFRHQRWRGYKAGRPRAPTPLSAQLARLPEVCDAFGFPLFDAPGFEADDVLATLSRELREAGARPLVVTADLDALQCAIEPARVYAVGRGTEARVYDQAAVWTRFGVAPAELPDWKALAGDASDEIPGVPGVGASTATALVRRFGNVEGVLARLAEVEPQRVRQAIAACRQQLPVWRDLATLRDDLRLPAGPRWAPVGSRERLRAFFEALEFRSLVPRLEALG